MAWENGLSLFMLFEEKLSLVLQAKQIDESSTHGYLLLAPVFTLRT